MKKSACFIVISMLVSLLGRAQILVDTANTWNVVTCYNFGPCVTTFFSFEGDTTIGLHQYKKLMTAQDSAAPVMDFLLGAREDTVQKYVYYNYSGNEYLAYDFSLEEGDTFSTDVNGCFLEMVVDSVDSVMLLNGELRKRLIFSDVWIETWIEGIGNLLGLTYNGANCSPTDIYPELLCFHHDNNLQYTNPDYNTCNINTTEAHEVSFPGNFKIYPDPATDRVFIHGSEKISAVSMYDLSGRLIENVTWETGNSSLDISTIANGIYLLTVFSSDKASAIKFVVQH